MIYRGPGFLVIVRFGSTPTTLLRSASCLSFSVLLCVAGRAYTVYNLRSLNLHFFCVFRIESKIVHVGAEKIITLY